MEAANKKNVSGRNSVRGGGGSALPEQPDIIKMDFLSTLQPIDPTLKGMPAAIAYQRQNKILVDQYRKLETICNDQNLKIKELMILNESKKITKQSELQEKHEVVVR